MARKATKKFDVQTLREMVNLSLTRPNSMGWTEAHRLGAAYALESVLHETGNYRGFCYLDGYGPYLFGQDGQTKTANPQHDESRRRYF